MSKKHPNSDSPQVAANQSEQASEAPVDDSRNSDQPARERVTPVGRAEDGDVKAKSTIEAFDEEGAGIAAKE